MSSKRRRPQEYNLQQRKKARIHSGNVNASLKESGPETAREIECAERQSAESTNIDEEVTMSNTERVPVLKESKDARRVSDRTKTSGMPSLVEKTISKIDKNNNDHNPFRGKRKRDEREDRVEQSRKRVYLDPKHNCLSSLKTIDVEVQRKANQRQIPRPNTMTVSPQCNTKSSKGQFPRTRAFDYQPAPVEMNPECRFEFVEYGNDSLPIMYSEFIKHDDSPKLLTEPSTCLRQRALALLQRKWTSSDLGRSYALKSGSVHTINDCDLYFRGGKVHVASDRGLLLAADYLKLIGIPDEQPVCFAGRKPAWTKLEEAKRHYRKIEEYYQPTSIQEQSQGFMTVTAGSTVLVLERVAELADDGELLDLAYGLRLSDGVRGWFPYEITCRIDWSKDEDMSSESGEQLKPDYIDWTTFVYAPNVAVSASASPVSPPEHVVQSNTSAAVTAEFTALKSSENIRKPAKSSRIAVPLGLQCMAISTLEEIACSKENILASNEFRATHHQPFEVKSETTSIEMNSLGIADVDLSSITTNKRTGPEHLESLKADSRFREPKAPFKDCNDLSLHDSPVVVSEMKVKCPYKNENLQPCCRYTMEDEVDYSDGEL